MTFKPALWSLIAVVLSAANLVAGGFAAASAEGAHAAIHAGLALLFGLWAQRLRQRLGRRDLATPLDAPEALAALEADVNRLRQEVSEMQERSEEHTSELQSQSNLVCRLLLEKKKKIIIRSCSRAE